MRDCRRNQRKIWYSLYQGKEKVLKDGLETGQHKEIYSDPVCVYVCVSAATGTAETALFGAAISYDRILSTVKDLPIDEYSRVWIDVAPNDKADNFDYKVKRVAKGLNQHLWAVEKVTR